MTPLNTKLPRSRKSTPRLHPQKAITSSRGTRTRLALTRWLGCVSLTRERPKGREKDLDSDLQPLSVTHPAWAISPRYARAFFSWSSSSLAPYLS